MTATDAARPAATTRPSALVGNRLVLVGAVLYLLEWVAIIAASVDAPVGASVSGATLLSTYAGHADAYAWAAGWFSVVLLGRILIMTGLRTALVRSGRPQPLMDLAVGAMAVSVVIEIVTYALVAGTAWSVGHGGSAGAVRTMDSAAFVLDEMLWGALGVSLVCAGLSMWVSGLFSRILSGLAVLGGVLGVVDALAFTAPRSSGLADAVSSGAALPFWIWMLWTGVVLWRARPAPAERALA